MPKRICDLNEHHDGGMTEIKSRKAYFLENDFLSTGEMEKDIKLCGLEDVSKHIIHSLKTNIFITFTKR